MDRDRGLRSSISRPRDYGIVEVVQREYDRHGGRDDFLQLRGHSVPDGGGMRQFQSGLATGDATNRQVKPYRRGFCRV